MQAIGILIDSEYGEMPLYEMKALTPEQEAAKYYPTLVEQFRRQFGRDPESEEEAWTWHYARLEEMHRSENEKAQ